MHPMLNIAIQAARNAGKIITRFVDDVDANDINEKARNDFVTKVDQLAEEEIIRVIRQNYPRHSILAKESGLLEGDEPKIQWIIDPLDGTTNFIHGFPHFSVSIAAQINNRTEIGVVYDPMRQELFTATRGQGAQLNSRKIRVSTCKKLENALLGTGFPYRKSQHLRFYLNTFESLFPLTAGVRRVGSAALDLAYVAAGRLEGFWEMSLKPWDIAAGALLVTEAGGIVSDFNQEAAYLDSGNVIAACPKLHRNIASTVESALRE